MGPTLFYLNGIEKSSQRPTAAHQREVPFGSLLDDASASPAGLTIGPSPLILPRDDRWLDF